MTPLEMKVWVDDSDSPADIIDALALSPFATRGTAVGPDRQRRTSPQGRRR